MKFLFGDIVVVEENLIGVICKSWLDDPIHNKEDVKYKYDVYVRSFNSIVTYKEDEIERYKVRHKELNEEEMEYQKQ